METAGRVQVEAEVDGYRLEVETRDVTRTLRHASCARLLESAAVIVALGAEAEPEPQPAPASAAPPPAAPAESAREPPRPEPRERALHLRGWLEATGLWGLVPGVTVRPALGFGVRGARLGGAVGLDYATPSSTSGVEGVRVHGPGASLLLTGVLHTRVHAGLGADAHLLWGRGRGVDDVRTQRIALWSGRLELVAWPLVLPRTSVGLVLSGALPFARPGFVFADGATAFRPERLWVFAGVRFAYEQRR